jgi:hypothetical protein
MAKLPPFPLAVLDDSLSYNPETGEFRWKKRPSNSVRMDRPAGAILKNGYRRLVVQNYQFYAHHAAWYLVHREWPDQMIDHANGDRADNRLANLRLATQAQQNYNMLPGSLNRSGVRGVCWHAKGGYWRAYITANRRQKFLGNFDNFNDAVAARKRAEETYCGEFLRLPAQRMESHQ